MTRREWVIGLGMLTLGLVVGSTKGDDLIEKIQGVETVYYDLDNHQELANRFNSDIRHRLSPTIPERLKGSKLESQMLIMADRYHFDFTIGGEKVAELEYDKDEKFIGGGWLVQ